MRGPATVLDQAHRLGRTRLGVLAIGRVISPLQRQLYRRTGGRFSLTGRVPVLLLTTIGRRTGLERTVPLLYLRADGRLVVCNVNPGFERTNPWVLNLRAEPRAQVQLRRETFPVVAREATPQELEHLWPQLTRLWPAYQQFYDQGGRRTVFVLSRVRGKHTQERPPSAAAPSLWSLCWGSLGRPRQTARVVASSAEPRQARAMVGGFALLYSLGTLGAHLTGRRPQRSPLMRVIPAERYYLWESVFQPQVTVAWMTLFSTLVRVGARRVGGSGTWQSDFNALAIGHTTPLIAAMWLPDMVCYLLRVDERRYLRLVAVYAPTATAWALAVSTLGISEAEGISWRKAAATVLVADGASALATGIPFVMR